MKQSNTWQKLSQPQKIKSLEAELAKAKNELACLRGDAEKINSRLSFALAGIHSMKTDGEVVK